MKKWMLVAVALVAGCVLQSAPGLEITSIDPAEFPVGEGATIAIFGRNFLPGLRADYEDPSKSSVDGAFRVRLDREDVSIELPSVVAIDATRLEATVPANAQAGTWSVTVVDPRGREDSLEDALRIVSKVATPTPTPFSSSSCGSLILTRDVTPVADTYLDAGEPQTSQGDRSELKVGGMSGCELRPLLSFDIGALPSNATVVRGLLTLELTNGRSPLVVSVHRLTARFSETQSTWVSETSGARWIMPGGDYDPLALDAQPLDLQPPGGGAFSPVVWDVTPAVVDWKLGATNFGILLRTAANVPDEAKFASSESSAKPELRIDWCTP